MFIIFFWILMWPLYGAGKARMKNVIFTSALTACRYSVSTPLLNFLGEEMDMRTWQNIFPHNLHAKVMLYSLSSPCFRKFKVFWKAMKEGRHGPSFEKGAVLIRSSESRCWDVIRITRGLLHKRRENSVEDRRFTGMVLNITKVLVNPIEYLWKNMFH